MSSELSRRQFLYRSLSTTAGLACATALTSCSTSPLTAAKCGSKMRFGLVTYLWGRDWPLPTLIANCQKTNVLGVELRTEHAHGVEAHLNARQRENVKKQFDDSPVTLVGLGTNFEFHSPDLTKLRQNIEQAKQYVRLSYDVGASGVKVKPNTLPEGVPVEKTIEQLGRSLNKLGRFARDFDQEIRLEVHGEKTQKLPVIKQIFDHVTEPNIGICWNSNPQDLDGRGLEYNLNLVKDRLGQTVHVRELSIGDYPYQRLIDLFVKINYAGWILLEARTQPPDRIKALIEQRAIFEQMLQNAQTTT